jgi:autotransporter-associated beta strand protein
VDAGQSFTVGGAVANGGSAGSLTKSGSGTLVLSANNSYTGGTTINGGRISLSGTLASGVIVNNSGTLQGTGRINGTISGAGFVNPGNSPGILTAAQVDPTLGTDYGYEFTQTGNPTWSNAGASGNDVLRLTNATTPFVANLTAANSVGVYLNVASLSLGNLYRGGFFTDRTTDFTTSVDSGAYSFYVFGDGGGAISFNGVNYYTLAQYNTANSTNFSILRDVVQIASANFAGGTVNNGWVQQFEIITGPLAVPEPTVVLLMFGGAAVMYLRHRRQRRR